MAQISPLPFRSRFRRSSEAEKALLSPLSSTLARTASRTSDMPLLPSPTCITASWAVPPLTIYSGISVRRLGERQM